MKDVTEITILTGPPGCGKSTKLLDEMIIVPEKYLFAMPRIDLIEERVRDLQVRAKATGRAPAIVPIHGENGQRAPALRQVADAARDFGDQEHVIVLITHEALTTANLAGYEGWHIRIDEVPDAVAAGKLSIPAGFPFFQGTYDLEPAPRHGWYKVVVREDAPGIRSFLKDDVVDGLVTFHKRGMSPQGVYVDIADWAEAQGHAVRWCSVWTPAELKQFETAVIAGSGFFESVCRLATKEWFADEVAFTPRFIGAPRTALPEVRIGYFTKGHVGSTKFWESDEGSRCLVQVSKHLEGIKDLGYWSGNKQVQRCFAHRVPGTRVLPKIAGTNEYRDLTSCAFIYSNKAQRSDDTLLEVFGLSRDQIERARQTEDLFQFVMRGAIRCPDYGGAFEVFVYDLFQAEVLERLLRENGITQSVTLVPIEEAGIMDVTRPRPGPKPETDPRTLEERKAEGREKDRLRQSAKRAAQRQKRIEAGTYKPRGRPPKSASQQPSP